MLASDQRNIVQQCPSAGPLQMSYFIVYVEKWPEHTVHRYRKRKSATAKQRNSHVLFPASKEIYITSKTSATDNSWWHKWTRWPIAWISAKKSEPQREGRPYLSAPFHFMIFFLKCEHRFVRCRIALKCTIDCSYSSADTGTIRIQYNLCLSDIFFCAKFLFSPRYGHLNSSAPVLCLSSHLPYGNPLFTTASFSPPFFPPSLHVLQTTADPPLLHSLSLISIHDGGAYLSQWNAVAAIPR